MILPLHGIDISAKKLNCDLEKIRKWAFQWKSKFNRDPNKQANEVIFSKNSSNYSHPPVTFNDNDLINILITSIWALIYIQN